MAHAPVCVEVFSCQWFAISGLHWTACRTLEAPVVDELFGQLCCRCCGVPQALGTKPVLLWSCVAPAACLSLNLQVSHAVLLQTAFGG